MRAYRRLLCMLCVHDWEAIQLAQKRCSVGGCSTLLSDRGILIMINFGRCFSLSTSTTF